MNDFGTEVNAEQGTAHSTRRQARPAPRWLFPVLTALTPLLALVLLLGPGMAYAQEPAPAAPASPDAVTLGMAVRALPAGGFAAQANVNNNAALFYRIRLENKGAAPLTGISIESVMPAAGLDSIDCGKIGNNSLCAARVTTSTIVNELGDTEVVTVVRELKWNLSGVLAVNATRDVTFTARVVAQVGDTIENSALGFFAQAPGSAVSNGVLLNVVADVPASAVITATAVSTTPNWYSSDLGGTLDMDWGDVDLDGDLDLALASTLGASVYRNDHGQLTLLWNDPQARAAYSVRWVNVDSSGAPELIAIGAPNGAVAGKNFVFAYNPGAGAAPDRFKVAPNGEFDTDQQLTRLDAADYDGDGKPDLLVSVNAISAACPVFVLRNEGANLFRGAPRCVSTAGSAAMASADADGDGDPDVALGLFPNQVRVVLNKPSGVGTSGLLTITNPAQNTVVVDAPNYFLPYDFAWGDVDRDGDMDLVAAFPLQREVRIYRNQRIATRGGADTGIAKFDLIQPPLSTGVFLTPYAVDLGDMDRDGYLDLIVADQQPTIYWNTTQFAQPYSVDNLSRLDLQDDNAEIWGIRAVDQDGDGALEIAIANRSGPSLVLANYAPALSNKFSAVDGAGPAASVVWGDLNNDDVSDLLFGSPPTRNASRLFYSVNGGFSLGSVRDFTSNGLGAHVALVGDLGGANGQLDVLLDTPLGLRSSINGGAAATTALPATLTNGAQSAALGDADGDGDLDLALAASGGGLVILRNAGGGTLAGATQVAVPTAPANITSLAWGDYNGDHYLDLLVGAAGGATSLLLNNSNLTFTRTTLAALYTDRVAGCTVGSGRAAAWGDVDGDGRLDLALAFNLGANSGQVCILRNTGSGFTRLVQLNEDATGLDWGDWDNDGDLDLAMARSNAGARVYANIGGAYYPIWESPAAVRAAAVRFGDKDGDGDLDLGIARAGSGDSGYFENRSVTPAHLLSTAQAALLPVQSAYVQVLRPGATQDAYLYSSSEILAGPTHPTVTVPFRLYNPSGEDSDPAQPIDLIYSFSLDGGGSWARATAAAGQSSTVTATLTRTGQDFAFVWDAKSDKAIAENAAFRVDVVNPSTGPSVQQAAGVGVSPPFQVRATTCLWPKDPKVFIDRLPVQAAYALESGKDYAELTFDATLVQGSGVMTFTWTIDDNTAARNGQRMVKRLRSGAYNLTLKAVGKPCPETRSALATATFRVGTGLADNFLPVVTVTRPGAAGVADTAAGGGAAGGASVYLPAIANGAAQAATVTVAAENAPPAPLAGLDGATAAGRLTLTWQPPPAGATELQIVRWPLDDPFTRTTETTLPPLVSSYVAAQACGVAYAVLPANAEGVADTSSVYMTEPCTSQEVAQ